MYAPLTHGELSGETDRMNRLHQDIVDEAELVPLINEIRDRIEDGRELIDLDVHRAELYRYAKTWVPHWRRCAPSMGEEPLALDQAAPMTRRSVSADLTAFVSDEITSDSPPGAWLFSTSGTTAEPLRVLRDHNSLARDFALAQMRYTSEYGLSESPTILHPFNWIGARPVEFTSPARRNARVLAIPPPATAEQGKECVRAAERHQPELVHGGPSECLHFARLAKQFGGPALRKLKCAITTGSMLLDAVRSEIEEILQCPVYSAYGTKEVGTIAFECRNGQMHVESRRVHLPSGTHDSDPYNRPLYVTDVYSFVMPFINYDTGDSATIRDSQCGCGKPGLTLDGLVGRSHQEIQLGGSQTVPLLRITNTIGRAHPLQYQIQHTGIRSIVVAFVRSKLSSEAQLDDMSKQLHELVGPGFEVTIDLRSRLMESPSPEAKVPDYVRMYDVEDGGA